MIARKQMRGLAAVVLLAMAGGGWWLTVPRAGALLPRGSVKSASVSDWGEKNRRPFPLPAAKTYFWTDRGDLMRYRRNQDGSTEVVRDRLTPSDSLQPDTASPVKIPGGAAFLQPTPDGSGLLYWRPSAVHIHDWDVYLRSADGKTDRLLSALYMENLVWMPDGKHWIVSRMDGDFLCSLDGVPFRQLNTTSLSQWTPYVLGVNRQSHAIATLGNDWFEAPDPSHQITGVNYPALSLQEFDPLAPSRSPRKWRVQAPSGCSRGQIVFSPRADRILWIVDKQEPALKVWMQRLRLENKQGVAGDEALYVSRVDGSEMKELSSTPLDRQKWGSTVFVTKPLSDIRWLPDGKRISYVYKNALYIAPVN